MNINELVKTVQPYSMATAERLTWMANAAQQTIEQDIPGDFVECGVCNGGSAAILAHFAVPAGRELHLFDSWQGLPAITEKDTPSFDTSHPASEEVGKCVGDPDKVLEAIKKVGIDICGKITLWGGWFHETFPTASLKIQQIAMLNLDSDWYESEKLCLETWYDKVSTGGFIYFDDFYYWPGCQQAADEFLNGREDWVGGRIGKSHSYWVRKI